MDDAEVCARNAAYAERQYRRARNPLAKDSYRRIAQGWRELETLARNLGGRIS